MSNDQITEIFVNINMLDVKQHNISFNKETVIGSPQRICQNSLSNSHKTSLLIGHEPCK